MYYFYYPNKSPINNPEEFISFYSAAYYLNGRKISNASQTSIFIERDIERILFKTGIKDRKDVLHILAWKMGGIDQQNSINKYTYNKPDKNSNEWCEIEGKEKAVDWGNSVENVEKLIDYICEKRDAWSTLLFEDFSDAEQVLWDLKCCILKYNVKRIGPVYLVTLLYFISRGKFPIYDQQAMKALKAINVENKQPFDYKIADLPEVLRPDFWEIYKQYIDSLKDLCKYIYPHDMYRYQTDRSIDRALWVYGHLKFEKTEKR